MNQIPLLLCEQLHRWLEVSILYVSENPPEKKFQAQAQDLNFCFSSSRTQFLLFKIKILIFQDQIQEISKREFKFWQIFYQISKNRKKIMLKSWISAMDLYLFRVDRLDVCAKVAYSRTFSFTWTGLIWLHDVTVNIAPRCSNVAKSIERRPCAHI